MKLLHIKYLLILLPFLEGCGSVSNNSVDLNVYLNDYTNLYTQTYSGKENLEGIDIIINNKNGSLSKIIISDIDYHTIKYYLSQHSRIYNFGLFRNYPFMLQNKGKGFKTEFGYSDEKHILELINKHMINDKNNENDVEYIEIESLPTEYDSLIIIEYNFETRTKTIEYINGKIAKRKF